MQRVNTIIQRALLLPLMLLFALTAAKAQDEPPIVLSGDRTVIYIDRLPLRGDESLMDVLLMYPEQLVHGFDALLENYQLRMENVPVSLDIRQFLTHTPARACTKIQVCENPGVSKGRTGLGGIIDLNMRRNEEGVHGMAGVEAATPAEIFPMGKINYGHTDSAGYSTDMYANTGLSMSWPRNDFNITQYTDIHLNQRFGGRDRLLTYLRQSYEQTTPFSPKQNYMARARYFHTFNAIGTELLLLAGYQYGNDKTLSEYNRLQKQSHTKTGTLLYLVELNTPLPFLNGLNLMAGWEMDRVRYRYHLTQDMVAGLTSFDATDNYTVMNNDIYLQLDYTVGPVKLYVGDRVSLYHYDMQAYNGDDSRNDSRNFFMASIAATLAKGHQLQAGYYRRFFNPDYLMALPTNYPLSDGTTWSSPDTLADERKADVARLAYMFSQGNVNASLSTRYIHMVDDGSHAVQADVSASWMHRWLILSGGANFSHSITPDQAKSYVSVRLSPTFRLPRQWRITTQLILYSPNAPYRVRRGTAAYGMLAVEKRISDILDLSLLWHDPFDRKNSSLVLTAKILF